MKAPDDPLAPPSSNVFDGEKGTRGYRINKLAQSMRHPDNRAAFLADERGYMAKLGLTEPEQALILARDWYGLQVAGGNQYALVITGAFLVLTMLFFPNGIIVTLARDLPRRGWRAALISGGAAR